MKHRKLKRNQDTNNNSTPDNNAPENKTAQDDRNLVIVDDDFEGADFEERMWLFWERNKSAIITGIAASFIAIFGVYGYQEFQRGKLRSIQTSYMSATTPDAKSEFTKKHPKHILGGITALNLADSAYEAGDFTRAAELYNQAIQALDTQTAGPRASLGLGVSQAKSGNTDQAIQTLQALVDNPDAIASIQAEAAYHLAVISLSEEDYDAAHRQLNYITSLDGQAFWNERARMLKIMLPKNVSPSKTTEPATTEETQTETTS